MMSGRVILWNLSHYSEKSAGKPIQYHGEILMLMDKIPVPDKFKLSVILLSTHSEWQQAIKFKTKGKMTSHNSGIESHCFYFGKRICGKHRRIMSNTDMTASQKATS